MNGQQNPVFVRSSAHASSLSSGTLKHYYYNPGVRCGEDLERRLKAQRGVQRQAAVLVLNLGGFRVPSVVGIR